MDKLYWAIEFVRVLIAYFFIMFLWPSVVFKKHLKKRQSRTYKFAFCSVVQPIVVNTGVLGLGLVHILNGLTVNILFYGLFFFFLFKDVRIEKQTLLKGKYLISGTYGPRSFFSDMFRFIKKKLTAVRRSFFGYMQGHWFEYGLLFLLIVFGVIYFSMNAFQENSYGFGDLYVHNSWVYQLSIGNIFPAGVYPESMHCFIAVEHLSFGILSYNALLFTGPIFSSVILISIYILFRELFKWKYTPMIALALFVIVDVRSSLSVSSMSRFQWTMPQEYGFPGMFLCLAYVLRYFKNGIFLEKVKRIPKFMRDDDLRIFTFALASTIAAHFYATIMAFLLCIGAALVLIRRFFSKKFLPFVVACIGGVMIAMLPMFGAMAEGHHLDGSVRWAMSLMLSESQFNALFGYSDEEMEELEARQRQQAAEEKAAKEREEWEKEEKARILREQQEKYRNESSSADDEASQSSSKIGTVSTVLTANGLTNFVGLVLGADTTEASKPKEGLMKALDIIYRYGYKGMNGSERAQNLVILSFIVMGAWALLRIFIFIRRRMIANYQFQGDEFDGYIVIIVGMFIFAMVYCLGSLGLPQIIENYRVCSVHQVLCMALVAVPVDLLGTFIISRYKEAIVNIVTVILVVGVYVGAKLTGSFRGYLVIELTRYNSSVLVTNAINATMGKGANNFTIVSSTDELYPVLGYGFHEELISFINNSEVISYTIPTEYIFIMLEKYPIERAQHHFANGPTWIAEQKYNDNYFGGNGSVEPAIKNRIISEDYANLFFGKFPYSSVVYNTLWQRVLLNSKGYVWCQKFNAMYPNELHTFYEDDLIIVYYLKQNPRNLYELATMDPSVMVPPEDYAEPIWPEKYKNYMTQEAEEDNEGENSEKGEENGENQQNNS